MTQVENSDTREDLHGMKSLVGKTRLSDDPDLEKQWISFKETRSTDIKNDLLEFC